MKAKLLKPNDPRLRKISEKIRTDKIEADETRIIIRTMLKVAFGEQKDSKKPVMVGLAAPQIGIFKRIILVDTEADGKGKVGNLRIYINPEITWSSKREGEWYEGCYSTGKVCGIVSRPTSIKIRATVIMNITHRMCDIVEEKWIGYTARIFQHEIDHLNGKIFIDHIKDPDKLHLVEKDEFQLYRNQQAWKNWPKKYPYAIINPQRR